MTWIVLLFAAGLLLLLTEVLVPGGILGAIGGVLLLAGSLLSFATFGTTGGIVAVAAATVLVLLAFYLEFRILPRTAAGKRAFLSHEITATASTYGPEALQLVGSAATAATTLAPSGYITVNQQRYEAFCQTGFASAGTPLTVISADNFRLVVRPITDAQLPSSQLSPSTIQPSIPPPP